MSLNSAQRVVIVVASGVALMALRARILSRALTSGWFNYAPNSGISISDSSLGWDENGVLVLTLLMVVAWVAFALWLLRSRDSHR